MAKEFGATDTVNASAGDPVGQVMELTGQRGADVAFEVIGLAADDRADDHHDPTGRPGHPRRRPEDGRDGERPPAFFGVVLMEKTDQGLLVRVVATCRRTSRSSLDLYKEGDLKLDELISRTIRLDDVNEAFEAMETGEVARSVIDF